MVEDLSIGAVQDGLAVDYRPVLSLVFSHGQRPDAAALRTLSAEQPDDRGDAAFSISHLPDSSMGWAELLSQGLTFDCASLVPAPPAALPQGGALLGLESRPEGEAITLSPGPHLADAMGMLPVVRTLAAIGARLAALPEARAVIWNPARCWMPPAYYCKVVGNWLADGPFPALGLTSLERQSDGAIISVGLALLTGQELRFLPDERLVAADIARIGVRLIHALIESGPLITSRTFIGPDRETLLVSPNLRGTQLDVSVQR